MLALLAAVASANCSVPRTLAELETAVNATEASWGSDTASFADAVDAAEAILACTHAPVSSDLAARLLRVDGLRAFVARDLETASLSFSAARFTDPLIVLPEAWAPAGNPVRALWDSPPSSQPGVKLRAARTGNIHVNGRVAVDAPADAPFVFQWIDGLQTTGAIATARTLPTYPRVPLPARNPLLIGGGIAAVAAGTLYGLAWLARDEHAAAADLESLEGARARANGFTVASAGFGAGAVVALGAGLIVATF